MYSVMNGRSLVFNLLIVIVIFEECNSRSTHLRKNHKKTKDKGTDQMMIESDSESLDDQSEVDSNEDSFEKDSTGDRKGIHTNDDSGKKNSLDAPGEKESIDAPSKKESIDAPIEKESNDAADELTLSKQTEITTEAIPVIDIAKTEAESMKACSPYSYCDAELFPQNLKILGRQITCDQVPNPRQTCCLPMMKHIVCYNIMVNGRWLYYDPDYPNDGTDFTGLCNTLLTAQNATLGKYTSITRVKANGTGKVMFHNNNGDLTYRWYDTAEAGSYFIRDLACGIE